MAKAKKPAATAGAASGATPAAASPSAPAAPAAARVPLGSLISKPVLVLGLLVGLLSLAVDYLPARIEPVELDYAFAPRTLEQQQRYADGVGRAPNSAVFDAAERVLAGEMLAPESLAVSPDGKKVFAGLRDGRVVYFTSDAQTQKLTMHDFARTGNVDPSCGEEAVETICGRPLGLAFVDGAAYARYVTRMENPSFFYDSKMLLVADAYKGLLLMDAFGEKIKVFDTVGPRRVKFLNGLAVKKNGEVFVTDSSRRYTRREVHPEMLERQPTGRLLHFNPVTNRVTTLAKDLSFPNGVALVDDERALLVALMTQNKLVKYDIATKQLEDFAFLPGTPDNLWVETPGEERVFVGLTSLQPWWHPVLMGQPKVRKLMEYVLPPTWLREIASPHGAFVTVDLKSGDVTNAYQDLDGSAKFLAGVYAFGDYYYLTNWNHDFLTRIPKKAFQ